MGIHDGHRKRMIGRFLAEGLERFEPHQVLELLLFYAVPRQDTNELAHRLINTFGSLQGVVDAPYERLLEVPGVGENTASLLKLVPDLCRVYCTGESKGAFAGSPDAAGALFQARFLGRREEMVYAAFVDANSFCLGVELMHKGSVNIAEVNVRNLVARALAYNATGILLAHNHPGGSAIPSAEDVETTLQLRDSLKLVHVQLMDHLVFADRDFVSMRQSSIW